MAVVGCCRESLNMNVCYNLNLKCPLQVPVLSSCGGTNLKVVNPLGGRAWLAEIVHQGQALEG